MSGPNTQVTVHILDRDYHVACPPEDCDSLLEAAELLSRRMAEVRDSGRVIGVDRIAVMVALNLAHQYLEAESHRGDGTQEVVHRLKELRLMLAAANDGAAAG